MPSRRVSAALIFGASALFALSLRWFFQSAQLACGGLYGFSLGLRHLIPSLPLGATVFVLNLPLFALALRRKGFLFVVKNLAVVALTSALTDLFDRFLPVLPPLPAALACVCAGVSQGAALGILLRCGATTGGTELAAGLFVRRFPQWSIGQVCLAFDLAVLIFYAFAARTVVPTLYGGAVLWLETRTIDAIVYGGRRAKVAFIISGKQDAITRALLAQGLGITRLSASGAYSGETSPLLLCAVRRGEITALRRTVQTLDPAAFFILCDAREVLGNGFARSSEVF